MLFANKTNLNYSKKKPCRGQLNRLNSYVGIVLICGESLTRALTIDKFTIIVTTMY